jgi:hypothetical protein
LFSSLELIKESLGLGPDVELGVVVHQHYQVSVVNKPLKQKEFDQLALLPQILFGHQLAEEPFGNQRKGLALHGSSINQQKSLLVHLSIGGRALW